MSSSRTPLSIEALLEKQRKEKEETSKPKFLSKSERAAIALAKRAADVEASRDKESASIQARDELERKVRAEGGGNYNNNNYSNQTRGSYNDGGLNYGRSDQNNNRDNRGGGQNYNNRDNSRDNGRGRGGNYGNSGGGRGGGRGGIGSDRRNDRAAPSAPAPPRDYSNVPTGPKGSSGQAVNAPRSGGRENDRRDSPSSSRVTELDPSASTTRSEQPAALPYSAQPATLSESEINLPPPSDSLPPPPPPSDLPPPPPPPSADSMPPPPPPQQKLTLAEMAALQSTNAGPAPLNQALQARRYLGAKAVDKRKIRKVSDKKFNFDWEGADDTGADEVDPIYAPYIPPPPPPTSKQGQQGQQRSYGIGKDERNKSKALVSAPAGVQGSQVKVGLYGRGMLAGFDRDTVPGRNNEVKHRGAIDERHWSEKPLNEMKERDWRIFREDFSIAARGGQIPLPLRSWKESNIPQQIMDVIEEVGYSEPSPIQRQAIPIGLMNRDQIGIAETGSGKTAAFVVPMLAYIGRLPPLSDENRGRGPYALVLAPTRELAQQIESETNKFTKLLGYKCVSIVGGRAIEEQQFNMRFGAEIVIATPGRLKDCLERHVLVLGQCTYVVMDEADRMVSLGFEEVINFILDALPVTNLKPDTEEAEDGEKMSMVLQAAEGDDSATTSLALYRQTVMFSATMPPAVERLAKKYLRRPAIVTIGVAGQAVDTVDQRVEFVSGDDKKKARLIEILNTGGFEPPMIVFVNQKKGADVLMKDLQRAHWNVTTLHSGKNQEQREAALNSIRNGECDVLVATDLAGRGIDVPDVSLVVNFQMANTIEAYVHRIGRTGRAGKTGVAVTFLSDADEELMYDLKNEISKSPVSRCPPELLKHPAAQTKMSSAMKRQRDIED